MRHENVKVTGGSQIDWKGLGYLVSILSVFLLGAIAWPSAEDPWWHIPALVLGMTTSICGMGFRYMAHLQQLKEMKKTKAEARRR